MITKVLIHIDRVNLIFILKIENILYKIKINVQKLIYMFISILKQLLIPFEGGNLNTQLTFILFNRTFNNKIFKFKTSCVLMNSSSD